ncbi:MAG: hypothetical protein ABSB57_05695, partial [Dehalococcoidia bacterium]
YDDGIELTPQQQHDLKSLVETWVTFCRIEGKSEETVRSFGQTLDILVRAVRDEGLPQDPGCFTAAHVHQFLGRVASTGVSPITQWRKQRESRAFFSWLLRHGLHGRRSVRPRRATSPRPAQAPFMSS